jgi:hypothetical protein
MVQNEEIVNGLIKVIMTTSQQNKIIETESGEILNEQILDENILWTKLHSVASNRFGHTIYEINELLRTGNDALQNMCSERALDILKDITGVIYSSKRAIDAKSSESIGINRQTNNTTLIGMLGKNKQERVITLKENAKKSLFSSILGKEADNVADEDG